MAFEGLEKEHVNGALEWSYGNSDDEIYDQVYNYPDAKRTEARSDFVEFKDRLLPLKAIMTLAYRKVVKDYRPRYNRTLDGRNWLKKNGFSVIRLVNSKFPALAKRAERARVEVLRLERKRQSKFRDLLFEDFGGRCAVTGCDIDLILEAAHIIPVKDGGLDKRKNGLLLRSDIHKLFDAQVMLISPETGKTFFLGSAKEAYKAFEGQQAVSPDDSKRLENLKAIYDA